MVPPELFTEKNEKFYAELLREFPEASPEAIEAALQFMRVAARINVQQEAVFSENGLTSGRFALLMFLRREPGRVLSPSELARRAQVTRATMTQFLDALEGDGFVKRVPDPNDRRAMLVRLTAAGEAILRRVLPHRFRRLGHLTQVLTRQERKQLLGLLEKLSHDLDSPEVSATTTGRDSSEAED